MNSLTKHTLENIIQKYRFFIFDCDGVIWIEKKILNTTEPLIKTLKEKNKEYCFLTNNNSDSREKLLSHFHNNESLKSLVNQYKIYNAGLITSLHIKKNHPKVKKIFLIGSDDLKNEFISKDIEVVWGKQFDQYYDLSKGKTDDICIPDPSINGVVIGYDENINFFKIAYATRILSNQDTLLFGTNIDKNRKAHNGVLPGTNTMIACVESASERKAEIVTKPDPHCLEIILNDINSQLKEEGKKPIVTSEILMIGDNMTTDILFANNCGIDSLLLLTGVTTRELAENIIYFKENGKSENNKDDQKNFDIKKYGIPTYILDDLKL